MDEQGAGQEPVPAVEAGQRVARNRLDECGDGDADRTAEQFFALLSGPMENEHASAPAGYRSSFLQTSTPL